MAKYKLLFYNRTSDQVYRDIEFDCMDYIDIKRRIDIHKRNYYNLEISTDGLTILHTTLPDIKHIHIPEYNVIPLQ